VISDHFLEPLLFDHGILLTHNNYLKSSLFISKSSFNCVYSLGSLRRKLLYTISLGGQCSRRLTVLTRGGACLRKQSEKLMENSVSQRSFLHQLMLATFGNKACLQLASLLWQTHLYFCMIITRRVFNSLCPFIFLHL